MSGDRNTEAELDDAFAVLGDETRLSILQALWEHDERGARFSTLRKAVGMRDSGTFSYHLDELVPQFVRERDDVYRLTYAGMQVVGAAVGGTYTEELSTDVDPLSTGECPDCTETLEGRYERGFVRFGCPECGTDVEELGVPPILVSGHDDEPLLGTLGQYMLTKIRKRARGFCLLCDGQIEMSLTAFTDHERVLPDDRVDVLFVCQECGLETRAGVESVLFDHPAVISFLYDHGVDLREESLYERPDLVPLESAITSDDPPRVTATVAVDGDELEVTLDESLSVVDHTPLEAT